MRLFSSKKICIMIASAGLLFAGVLIGTSVFRQHGARRTFEEEGYILTMAEDEDQVIVNHENRFSSGSAWSRAGISSVAFRDEEGDRVVVDSDSFIHYDSNSLAAVKDGAISDMDQYLDGVIGCCYLPAGNTLVWDGSGFTAQSSDGEKRFENFIWKNSEQRYLLGSSELKIHFSGGSQEVSDSGFLELYYLGDDKKIMQLTSGDHAWQVVTKDCTVTFANGVVLNCEDGSISRSAQEAADSTDGAAAVADNTAQPTMSLQNIEIDATGSIMLGSTQYTNVQPTFHFTLFDGQDGASGENGAEGAPGEAGEDGEDGELGTEGAAGQQGQEGAAGSAGTAGGNYTLVVNGGVDTGVEIKTGIPAVIAPDEDWKITGTDRSFRLVYEDEAYETIEKVDGKAYVYLYDVKTGKILQEWKNCTIGSQSSPGASFTLDSSVNLQMDTTYGLAAIDTYTLGYTTYTTKLFEKIFTTDSSGVQIQLVDRAADSFSLGVKGDEYTSIDQVVVDFYDQNGAKIGTETYPESTSDWSRLVIGKTASIQSNTWYRMDVSVACKVNGSATTIKKELNWTTLKKEPVIGGLQLRAENGYLVAKVLGKYDGSQYTDPSDQDHALESITYRLYDATGLLSTSGIAKKEETSNSVSEVYFKIDGSLLMNQSTYYVVADYSWNDGARSIEVPVKETGAKKTSDSNTGISTDTLKGRAFAEAQALTNKGVSISFSGNGTSLYNLVSGDASEGTTYESIRGSLLINLNNTRLSVNDTRSMKLEITDNKTYKKTLKFTSCDGKQGDIEGSFALPLDVDGLLANNTYAFTLSAYVYDQSTEEYKYQSIGTLTIRTDAETDIVMGMRQASNGGTGVDFWLGEKEYTDAVNLRNYYDQTSKSYLMEDGTTEGADDYLAKTNASYRNLSTIVFELYKGASNDPDPSDLLGTCMVYAADSDGDRMSFMPGYSILYQKYYGKAVENCKDNSVGVGESFAHQFEYYYDTTHKYGKIAEDELSGLSGNYTIKVKTCYDYTYDRYQYGGSNDLYDYFIANSQLDMEDYVNHLTINNGNGLILADMVYQKRPIPPSSVTADNGYAVTVDPLLNKDMGSYNSDPTHELLYDEALLEDTIVGVDVGTYYSDSNKLAKTITFYGSTYDKIENNWQDDKSLTAVSADESLFGFKFTLPMTKDGTDTSLDDKDSRIAEVPHLWMFMYDETDKALKTYLDEPANGFSKKLDNDRGYSYRKYDAAKNVWLVYTDSSFLKRGQTYAFAYDAELDFTINDNNGSFSYPGDYYENEWVIGKIYAKNTALISQYTPLRKQEPQVDMELLTSNAADSSASETGSAETWQIYLYDPDEAVCPDSLLGYNKAYELVGCIYDAYGTTLTDSQNSSYTSYIDIAFNTEGQDHSMHYVMDKDDLNKDRVVAYLDNKPTGLSVTDAQKELMNALIQSMKTVNVDSSGNVTSAGAKITVKNLDPDGVYYSWQVVYRLLDDYQSKNEQGRIPLTEHFYAGHETWSLTSETDESFVLNTKNKTVATNGSYKVTTAVDAATNDIVSVDIERPDSDSNFTKDMDRIAAVQITAKKKKPADREWTTIGVKDSNGTVTEKPYEIWKSVYTVGVNYGFTFSISSFNQVDKGGSPMFDTGDQIQFTYVFYYESGERCTPQQIAESPEQDWYALKSVNGKQSNSALYEKTDQLIEQPETAPMSLTSSTKDSIYKIARTDGTNTKAPGITRTAVKGNNGELYITDIRQIYTLIDHPALSTGSLGNKNLTRTETPRYGVKEDIGYQSSNVTEFCKLGSIEAHATVSIGSIAPTLANYNIMAGITQMSTNVSIESYNLMPYPGGENLHLYYALYKVIEDEAVTGEKPEEKLELTGVMIGEADQLDEEGNLTGSRNIIMDKLEKNQKYRLYIYYKDNRDNTKPARTDTDIFGTALNNVKPGEFVTDPTIAKRLASCFTKTEDGNLVPADSKPVNNIRKIMGYKQVVVEKAGVDASGNSTPAVLDYYDEFTTLNGIVISEIEASLGYGSNYLTKNGSQYPTGDDGEFSAKKLTVKAETKVTQNEYTRMFFVLERCPINEKWTDETNWKTVMADNGKAELQPTDADYVPPYPTEGNPLFNGWDPKVAAVGFTKNNFQSYGTDYQYTALGKGSGGYVASMSLNYYPGQVIVPGYYYRVRAMLFQYEKGWKNPVLISLASATSDKQYVTSGTWIWQKFEYNESDLPVKVTNVEREQNSIRAKVRAANTGFYLDNHYYVRLWKYDNVTNKWVLLEDDKYYGTDTSGKSWNKEALAVNTTYTVSFEHLAPNTRYQLRFYGLMDGNYDNHLNIKGSSPLGKEDNSTLIYSNLEKYQNGTETERKNNLQSLYEKYLGIKSYKEAGRLKISTRLNEADQVLLNSSTSITTFAEGQKATIGEKYDYRINASARQIQLFFENASGLGNAQTISYTISYMGSTETLSGEITKAGSAKSPMDNGGTSGNVSLTITDDRIQFTDVECCYVQLVIKDAEGNVIEKPDPIEIVLD